MVNFLNKTRGRPGVLRPHGTITQRGLFWTFVLLVFFSVTGAFLGMLLGEAYQDTPFWMIVIPAATALLFGLASGPDSAVARRLNRIINLLPRRYQPLDCPVTTLPVLAAALTAAIITGIFESLYSSRIF